jgi:hypothetical protein
MWTTIKTLAFAAIAAFLYVLLGRHVPATGSTALAIVPACQLGGLFGYAALGAITYKGILSMLAFSALAKKV